MTLSILSLFRGRTAAFTQASDEPIRAELLSVERLEHAAEALAHGHRIMLTPEGGRPLAPRLRENASILTEAYRSITDSAASDQPITPAAEWLLDNFHIVEEQIREIVDDLPPGFYNRLPKLSEGPLAHYPRVFAIAWEIVADTDSGFDLERLTRFVDAYQRVQPLTIGELWAIAITLRITLVENLRRLAESLIERHAAYRAANSIADRVIGAGSQPPEAAESVLQSLTSETISRPFAVQLSQRLRDQDQSVIPILRWLDERLARDGTTADAIVSQEHQVQGAMNVTVRNIITSMRLISAIDWPEFVESVSLVDRALLTVTRFSEMDFPTRDLYRRRIEELAHGAGLSELDVTKRVLAAAGRAEPSVDDADRRRDPGYYLIGGGRIAFEREIGSRLPARKWAARINETFGIAGYIALVSIATAVILALALHKVADFGLDGWRLAILALVGLAPASDLAIALLNQLLIGRFGPAILPGLELEDGVPRELKTIVVMPVLLTSPADVEEQVKRLEVHFLASAEGELYYALLSDWTDSPTQSADGDDTLLSRARDGVADLNRRYGSGPDGPRFYLLHRRRVWNAGQGRWMGWERKRGKLHELNRLLRGAQDTTFIPPPDGQPAVPTGIRYVITLDADTRLPRGAARRLVGKMAHPLNRPRIDPVAHRVVEGHGILQPRVTPSLPMGRGGSLFQRAFSGANGMDPYAFAVSDIYQDLFGEGSYVGKGIYDVDCFEAALHGRIPENTVLSHDLLEGIFTRAALASDVELVEEYPSRYEVAAARQHRWTRGDWQLAPWIFWRGRGHAAGAPQAAIPLIGRWKMFDNLRRSLSAPSAVAGLLFCWFETAPVAGIWTAFVVTTMLAPLLVPLALAIVPQRTGISKRSHVQGLGADLLLALTQGGFLLTFLAHQASLSLDAVGRTLLRLFITKRRMLEWTTAAQAARLKSSWRSVAGQSAISVGFGAVALAILTLAGDGGWPFALPLLALWSASPILAFLASERPALSTEIAVPADVRSELRHVARATWRFFETFITAEQSDLPPDNFQEEPHPVVASRTSPTNIGLYLLATVAARDFGWQGVCAMADRLDATTAAMLKLERFRGHFYNWYDTTTLKPLDPKYISSVDSGNLAGHLVALGNACREMIRKPLVGSWADGLGDAVGLAREAVRRAALDGPGAAATRALDQSLAVIAAGLRVADADPVNAAARLIRVTEECGAAYESAGALANIAPGNRNAISAQSWVGAIRDGAASHRRDLDELAPWATLLAADPVLLARLGAIDAPNTASLLDRSLSIAAIPAICDALTTALASHADGDEPMSALVAAFRISARAAADFAHRLEAIAGIADALYAAMAFGFLFDPDRQLLSIGYQVQEGRLDGGYYDLLASEARLASFVAIAKGDLPARHWFRLGRTLTPIEQGSVMISWSGSMFEYLMPSLVMEAPVGSLIEHTNRLVVRRQISYGAELGKPWGISESQYNARDLEFTYQYTGFGVPDLGYKRTLGNNIVIAPYATGLAAMVDFRAAAANYKHLEAEGGRGEYGWYEALDYTPDRLPEGAKVAVIRAYMAHHQAMSIIAIGNALSVGDMRTRFHAEPIVEATELLLQERMPRGVPVARPPARQPIGSVAIHHVYPEMQRRFGSPHSRVPRTHLLSNGRYSVMVTGAGSGFSHWRGRDVTRWREDVTCDGWGSYIYLRDMRTGDVWSAGYQPMAVEPERYEVVFSEDRVEILREEGGIATSLVVAISPEEDAEVRRVQVTNQGSRTREIEITSFAELALAPHLDDRAHPAFSKLFIETEFLPEFGAILARRRARTPGDPEVWAAHLTVVEGETIGQVQFETDRGRFLGRGQGNGSPAAIMDGWPLSNTAGAVLDPIFSLRRRVRLPRSGTATVAFWTMVAESRDAALGMLDKHREPQAYERATTLAWTQAQVQLHHLGIGPAEAHLYQRLANRILYADPTLRPPSDVLGRGLGPASILWANGISGDLPIMLIRIADPVDLDVVRQAIRATEYFRMKRLAIDLVIVNERPNSYIQDLQNAIEMMVRTSRLSSPIDGLRGGAFVLRADIVSPEVLTLLQSAARVMILARRGSLGEQVRRLQDVRPATTPATGRRIAAVAPPAASGQARPELEFFNGFGGFAADGQEYVTVLETGQWTPAPWINVIANPGFGFHVSTDGSGFTWAVNSQQNQITGWSNDPVRDPPGEILYLRDDETGQVWTPTALPIREDAPYLIRHGQGYSRFEHLSHEIGLDLLQFVPVDDPVKISRLTITNHSGRPRRLSVTAYVEWVLGTSRGASAPTIVTALDGETRAIFASNPWNTDFGRRVAFVDLCGRQTSWTADRTEFIGRNGGVHRPAALVGSHALSGAIGAGFDPCAALQTAVTLAPGAAIVVTMLLGQADDEGAARALVEKYRLADLDAVRETVARQWRDMLQTVQVKTPDRAMDILLNAWLPYQVLACRVWARAAFYQASGAYGFRDQLQDVMALCVSRPDIARAHILRAAARQFPEGDVQHWWLAESGRGIRTRISDDAVWLSYVTLHYVGATGDVGILDEPVGFLDGPRLKPEQNENFFQPGLSAETASLYEHCARGLDYSLGVGAHGLPLMGTGDWNDGMNHVGSGGKGESVWLGWFLHLTMTEFAHLASDRGDARRAANWMVHAASLKDSLDQAWDGDWYRRAYFDDGSPMGSIADAECMIDGIAQSWSVISRAGEPARAQRAMAAVEKYLVRRDDRLVLLFSPPFDHSDPNPGYIQGYPPGVRENGGQYTHGSIWSVLAFAMLGDGDRAGELFSMMNPIHHGDSPSSIHRYRVEPYVACGDLYSMPPQTGRGGWTWYSGSAGWMYRIALEGILGFRLQGETLVMNPCIARTWPGFSIAYRHRSTPYQITIENPAGVSRGVVLTELDGVTLTGPPGTVSLVDDGRDHRIRIVLG